MFRKISITGGFTNEGLEIENETNSVNNNHVIPALQLQKMDEKIVDKHIQISRPKYDQKKLHDEFNYNVPDKDSGELPANPTIFAPIQIFNFLNQPLSQDKVECEV